MRTVIVGCGRVGAMLAVMLDDGGHSVTVLDISTGAFDRLPSTFKGNALRGDGTDEDTLRRAGAEDADLFLAMTEGDNRNIMAAQLAAEAFRVGQVIAKINDPAPGTGLRRAGDRHDLPDGPDGQRGPVVPEAAGLGRARRPLEHRPPPP